MQLYLPIAEVSVNAFLVLGLGGIVGFLSGMFGVGGGFLMTPILIFIGIPPAVAVATQTNQIVASSASGAIAHFRRRSLDLKMGLWLTLGGAMGSVIGVQIFAILREHCEDVLLASDAETVAAMRLLWERLKLVVEPSCAVPLAALLRQRERFAGLRVGIILSGGNVDLDALPGLLALAP